MLSQAGKYLYTIRSVNGVLVKNLQVYGKDRADADEKIMRMYMRCEIISCERVEHAAHISSNYEDVLDTVIKSETLA